MLWRNSGSRTGQKHAQKLTSICQVHHQQEAKQKSGRDVHFPASFLFTFHCKSLKRKVDTTKSVTIKVLFVYVVGVVLVVVFNAAVYDKQDYCPAWAAGGECKKSNWTWMRDNCPLSCGIPREYLVHLHIWSGRGVTYQTVYKAGRVEQKKVFTYDESWLNSTAWLAQSIERRTAMREVEASIPRPDQHSGS